MSWEVFRATRGSLNLTWGELQATEEPFHRRHRKSYKQVPWEERGVIDKNQECILSLITQWFPHWIKGTKWSKSYSLMRKAAVNKQAHQSMPWKREVQVCQFQACPRPKGEKGFPELRVIKNHHSPGILQFTIMWAPHLIFFFFYNKNEGECDVVIYNKKYI